MIEKDCFIFNSVGEKDAKIQKHIVDYKEAIWQFYRLIAPYEGKVSLLKVNKG